MAAHQEYRRRRQVWATPPGRRAAADSKVKDMGLAKFGRWAEHMPGLMASRKTYQLPPGRRAAAAWDPKVKDMGLARFDRKELSVLVEHKMPCLMAAHQAYRRHRRRRRQLWATPPGRRAASDSKVKDIGLAKFGRWAEHEMPGLMAARNKYHTSPGRRAVAESDSKVKDMGLTKFRRKDLWLQAPQGGRLPSAQLTARTFAFSARRMLTGRITAFTARAISTLMQAVASVAAGGDQRSDYTFRFPIICRKSVNMAGFM